MVDLVWVAFGEGRLAEETVWQAVVLIPKGERDYRDIVLVEVMWKVVAEFLNRRLTASIIYHGFIYRFRAGRGTVTATLKAKLLQQLEALREKVLYVIFLDLHKWHDTLDRSKCLKILEGYSVVPQAFHILWTYCIRLSMVAKAGGHYWAEFKGSRGVNLGDPISTTIFNVVVDSVVRHLFTVMV